MVPNVLNGLNSLNVLNAVFRCKMRSRETECYVGFSGGSSPGDSPWPKIASREGCG
jgi:hypothetical protein